MIPESWQPFVETRRHGYRPEVPVIVSIVGDVKHEYPVFVVPDGQLSDIDFRVFVDLDVIVPHVGKNIPRLMELTDLLVRAGVRDLYLWDVTDDDAVCVMFDHEKVMRPTPCV